MVWCRLLWINFGYHFYFSFPQTVRILSKHICLKSILKRYIWVCIKDQGEKVRNIKTSQSRKVAGLWRPKITISVVDEHSELPIQADKPKQIWERQIVKLFSDSCPPSCPRIGVEDEPYILQSVTETIIEIKCDKSPGEDMTTAENFQHLSNKVLRVLIKKFNNILSASIAYTLGLAYHLHL